MARGYAFVIAACLALAVACGDAPTPTQPPALEPTATIMPTATSVPPTPTPTQPPALEPTATIMPTATSVPPTPTPTQPPALEPTPTIMPTATSVPPTPTPTPQASVDALAKYDDNGNGRVSCAEARNHGIAPVQRGHPAYQYMTDRDRDGVVCE